MLKQVFYWLIKQNSKVKLKLKFYLRTVFGWNNGLEKVYFLLLNMLFLLLIMVDKWEGRRVLWKSRSSSSFMGQTF